MTDEQIMQLARLLRAKRILSNLRQELPGTIVDEEMHDAIILVEKVIKYMRDYYNA